MNELTNLTPQQLRNAADLKEQIEGLQIELNQLLGAPAPAVATAAPVAIDAPAEPKNGRKKRRKLSPQAIANIRAGVARRMAKRGRKPAAAIPGQRMEKPKRERSAAHRKALSEAMKARWAKVRRAGKSRL